MKMEDIFCLTPLMRSFCGVNKKGHRSDPWNFDMEYLKSIVLLLLYTFSEAHQFCIC